jgi:hypothetical protein
MIEASRRPDMNDGFAGRVRGAAVAGWWTLLVGAAVLSVQWCAYLFMTRARPAWAAPWLLGPGMSWDSFLSVWWLFTVVAKGLLLLLALLCTWLTLWARRLRNAAGAWGAPKKKPLDRPGPAAVGLPACCC